MNWCWLFRICINQTEIKRVLLVSKRCNVEHRGVLCRNDLKLEAADAIQWLLLSDWLIRCQNNKIQNYNFQQQKRQVKKSVVNQSPWSCSTADAEIKWNKSKSKSQRSVDLQHHFSVTHSHADEGRAAIKVPDPPRTTWGSVICSRTLWHVELGIEPPAAQLVGDLCSSWTTGVFNKLMFIA